jgi:hypothetical protein
MRSPWSPRRLSARSGRGCTFGFATCNNNCIEPVNFAYMQTNGVPAGPPSPQLANVNTFTPNRHTLMFNPG